jgi:hypothetical protein
MKQVFAVVDDFYEDPDDIRQRALGLIYRRPAGVNYSGVVATAPDDIAPIVARLSRLLGGVALESQAASGSFRITTAADAGSQTSLIHADAPDLTAIIYLSKHQTEGTYFYRHKALGIERISFGDPWLPMVRRAVEQDTLNLAAWEVTEEISMRYNRLVVFDGKYFHSGAQMLTGHSLAEGRMTQNFFFVRSQGS